jgi:hypothetical protein
MSQNYEASLFLLFAAITTATTKTKIEEIPNAGIHHGIDK